MYQDNQSVILLERHGFKSVEKGTRYARIGYFFVTNKFEDKEIKVLYYPTDKMLANCFTKPLQGSLLITHRNSLIGIKEDDFIKYLKEYSELMDVLNID